MVRHGKAPAANTPVDSSSSRDFSSITADTTQRSGELEEESSNQTSFAGEVVEQIEDIVESFRTGKTKKAESISRISQLLADEPTGNEQLKSDSLERYVSTLNGIEAVAAQSDRHGMRITSSTLGKRKDGIPDGGRRSPQPEGFTPAAMNKPTSTTSFKDYPRETLATSRSEGVLVEETPMPVRMMDMDRLMSQDDEDFQTRNRGSTSLRCRGSK
jgi:hypothetical protein